MQHDDNSYLKPKRRNRSKRGKGNKSKEPTTHSFWSNLGNSSDPKLRPIIVNANNLPILNKQNQTAIFLTPDQQPKSVVELTDDNAPNNPMIDGVEIVKQPKTKHEYQIPKQQPVKWSNLKNIGNKQKLQNPGLRRRYYQEPDFTADPDDIDFTDYISEPINPGTLYNNQCVIKKQDTSIKLNKSTEQIPPSKLTILSNQLVNSVPVTLVNQPITSSNKPVTSVNKLITSSSKLVPSVNKPTLSLNKPANSANKPVTAVNKPATSVNKPATSVNKPATAVNKPVTAVNKPATSAQKSVTAVNKPATSTQKPVTEVNKPATSTQKPVTEVNKPAILIKELVNAVYKPPTSVQKPGTSTNKLITLVNKPVTSKPIKISREEVSCNFTAINNVDTPAIVTTVPNKKGTIQVLNRTFQPYAPNKQIMESKNDTPNVVQPQACNIKQRGNMFYGPMMTFSLPKGIPRSFLQARQETIVNNQQNPQMNAPMTNTMPNWASPQTSQYPQQYSTNPQTIYNYNIPYDSNVPTFNANAPPIFVQTENLVEKPQQYSPSETYADLENNEDEEAREGSESPDLLLGSQKRLSAFQRLGPQTKPKKPKLTINLMFNKEQAVREVVNEADEKPEVYKPVHLREEIISSKDETVVKYLPLWPYRKNLSVKKHISYRQSKSVMILELEQMQDEVYDKDNMYVQITIKGYPPNWKKEQVLDVILDSVKGRSFIPIFIEFNENECKFFVIRCCPALMSIHKYGFIIRQDDVELKVVISQIDLTVKHIDFIPRLVLRKRLSMGYDGERKLNLKAFTLGNDISHFLYYPLHRLANQLELVQLQSNVAWDYLTDLDLSHNKLTTLQGFGFPTRLPKVKNLNLSHNYLEKATVLLQCRGIPLNSIWLEGNPLCHDYIDPTHYVRVLKMMFPSIVEIDGTQLQIADKLPTVKKNYCPEDAVGIINKFLEVFFPLLESGLEHRTSIQELYDEDASMTITYKFKLRYGQVYRYYRNLFLRCRVIDEGEMESIEGSSAITKLITKWPGLKHDPYTFTVDVMYHDENTTILRISGIVKLTAETLAEDEHLLAFTRTLVLHSRDGQEYKIKNEMVYWDEPTDEYAGTAFQVTMIKTKPLGLKLESTPDDDLKEKLVDIFMQLTDMEKAPSVRCLEMKEWNLKNALEYFTKLLKLDSTESI